MGLDTINAGVDTGFSTKLNDNFGAFKLVEIYTGTGFDVNNTTSNSTETDDHELTAVTSGDIANADYVKIEINAYHELTQTNQATTSFEIEIKEVGGSYSTIFDNIVSRASDSSSIKDNKFLNTQYVHTLTAGEKSNGFQIKITGKGQLAISAQKAAITNNQTIISLMA